MNTLLNDRISLFCECFGDTQDTARELFLCSDVLNVSLIEDNRLVAMASLVPIIAEKYNAFGYYIYGVCVAPDRRGRGLFRAVMEKAETLANERGATFVCLVPGNDRLAVTYKKMGYILEVSQKNEGLKKFGLKLISVAFRNFAKSDDAITKRQTGLLKIMNKEEFCPCEGELCFLDDMGDV